MGKTDMAPGTGRGDFVTHAALLIAAAQAARQRDDIRDEERVRRRKLQQVPDEYELLKAYNARLLVELRPVGDDGIQPPVLRQGTRKLREQEIRAGSRNGNAGPVHPELMGARIHAVMLVMYQFKVGLLEAFKLVAAAGGLPERSHALPRAWYSYTTDEELAYKPYGYAKAKKKPRD